jgi:PKD repeat protein
MVSLPTFFVDENITNINEIATWNWDFGDGFYSNVMNPAHTFPATGEYTVTLTVNDTCR